MSDRGIAKDAHVRGCRVVVKETAALPDAMCKLLASALPCWKPSMGAAECATRRSIPTRQALAVVLCWECCRSLGTQQSSFLRPPL